MSQQQGIEVVAGKQMVWMTIHQGVVAVPIRVGFAPGEAISLARTLEEAAVNTGAAMDATGEQPD